MALIGSEDRSPDDTGWLHPAWLPRSLTAPLRARTVLVVAPEHPVIRTVVDELSHAGAKAIWLTDTDATASRAVIDLTITIDPELPPESFRLARHGGQTSLVGADPKGVLYGHFHLLRRGRLAFQGQWRQPVSTPAIGLRMLDHWDNIDVHPVMGQVERGYAGGSLFYDAGSLRWDLGRVDQYARLLASVGVNAVSINNVNVHATETTLLTTRLDWVTRLADHLRPWGITVFLSVNFAAPIVLGDLDSCDPCDQRVRQWWADTTDRVYAAVPDLGGYLVKADSEGQPGPFAYGRSHADGANLLARALSPHQGVVLWRCFVYNHRQDWRDRSTDRARAAFDHFVELDGAFLDNVILQIKHGPIDFQVREPVSPLLAAMPRTRVCLELQVTAEYTGQQRHVHYLPEAWQEILGFRPWGDETKLWQLMAIGQSQSPESTTTESPRSVRSGGAIAAVSNVGRDEFWTGHPFAQANLYGFARLAWDPTLTPAAILDEWIGSTFPEANPDLAPLLRQIILGSRALYESYTAPNGVGFMVTPGSHYGPSVDGYEYSPWGTYHFADREGIGVDRTRASGSGYTGQYHQPWADLFESVETCPEELLLFFHHVRWDHRMHDGDTLAQHIYNSHFDGAAAIHSLARLWTQADGLVEPRLYRRVAERLDEQCRCAQEWCDQITSYVWRHSGIPDDHGRPLY
ncbi:MAG: hypothetical protein LBV00_00500 [Propionibacteriaceae bacterium]|jgi:alpha-glucuronidase|nr:hypothetical protein [Propionibacteriaceae bacterium]